MSQTIYDQIEAESKNFADRVRAIVIANLPALVADALAVQLGAPKPAAPEAAATEKPRAKRTRATDKPAGEKRPRTGRAEMEARAAAMLEFAASGAAFAVSDAAKYLGIEPRDASITARRLAQDGKLKTTGSRGATKYQLAVEKRELNGAAAHETEAG